ncbi:hypothetical protein B0H16DRAFT_1664708 [Mycena metata]|uniref:Peptidase M20 dimerisation domain-containing protein n=1 Tax=Mycena metata TaxID=1033252 RepID=A0AAD7I8W6_9AGAR|nr:hypothetical protein B0H16DRAFT_1664708 [Mycena metata]
MDAKSQTELPGVPPPPRFRRARWSTIAVGVSFLALLHFFVSPSVRSLYRLHGPLLDTSALNGALWNELIALHATSEFITRAVGQLSAAVQLPTETFDEMDPVGEDERWVTRAPNASLELQRVNTYGLIYIWQGSDTSLKPLLLMSHYDVVPVAPSSADQWTHPAYSGYFDGEDIWGRGSWDDKYGVISKLVTIEALLEKNFVPTRTVVLSFGFDEEAGGAHSPSAKGARFLAPALLERFGPDSFAMIVDEGGGFVEQFGGIFALPGVAEKGAANVNIEIQTPGGHSSIPPEHTSIGMLAALIVHFENNAPVPSLEVDTPVFEMLQCFAVHAPDVPSVLKRAVLRARRSRTALKLAEAMLLEIPTVKAVVSTTQAVDVISGGVKSNALPEQAMAVVNHRIATQSSVNATLKRDAELFKDLAARFNLSVTAFGELLTPAAAASASYGSLSLRAPETLEPSPISPSDAAPFHLFAGTIRATFHAARKDVKGGEKNIYSSRLGSCLGMAVHTRFYWDLSPHIYRYGHDNLIGIREESGGIHSVDEHIHVGAFMEMITFFTTLILNADEAML